MSEVDLFSIINNNIVKRQEIKASRNLSKEEIHKLLKERTGSLKKIIKQITKFFPREVSSLIFKKSQLKELKKDSDEIRKCILLNFQNKLTSNGEYFDRLKAALSENSEIKKIYDAKGRSVRAIIKEYEKHSVLTPLSASFFAACKNCTDNMTSNQALCLLLNEYSVLVPSGDDYYLVLPSDIYK